MTSLVVVSHPDPHSLTQHVARATADAIRTAGDNVEFADLAAENFDARFSDTDLDLFRGKGTTPADVQAEQERIDRADQLILVFPVYWWSAPALLKGWIDRVFVGGWAYDDTGGEFVKKLGRLTMHLILVAGDSSESFERHGVYEAIRTQIERGIIEYCGATHGSTSYIHDSDSKGRDTLAAEVREISDNVATRATELEKVCAPQGG